MNASLGLLQEPIEPSMQTEHTLQDGDANFCWEAHLRTVGALLAERSSPALEPSSSASVVAPFNDIVTGFYLTASNCVKVLLSLCVSESKDEAGQTCLLCCQISFLHRECKNGLHSFDCATTYISEVASRSV